MTGGQGVAGSSPVAPTIYPLEIPVKISAFVVGTAGVPRKRTWAVSAVSVRLRSSISPGVESFRHIRSRRLRNLFHATAC
ncbi:hypothetical protein RHECNPAF_89005 [Rhizobium etli CNPAF512]|nr:hypothetical protein RHECNPAF_89005 [Rhizobium etli CNPAF512]